jgi:hypothetical protein
VPIAAEEARMTTMQRNSRRLGATAVALATLGVSGGVQHAQYDPLHDDVEYLAHDDRGGRISGQAGGYQAFTHIHDALLAAGIPHGNLIAQGLPGDGLNLLARIDGSDPALSDQYVLVGAHYDHVGIGPVCDDPLGVEAANPICNGATDNATGVAVVLEIARRLAQGPTPARSVVFAFWDREEIDMGGSAHFRTYPLASPWPQQLVTYVNYDIQGANLLPALRSTTFAVGAGSGGPELLDAVVRAAASAPQLITRQLSEPLGQYTSDYANFVAPATVHRALGHPSPKLERIPTVFFTDSRGPCYHTTQDELEVVDFDKLEHQATIGAALVSDLAGRAIAPVIVDYDAADNAEFERRLNAVAKDLAAYVPELAWFDPGPIPPPTATDVEHLLAVAQAARNDAAIGASARSMISEQIRVLTMIRNGQGGLYSPLFWYRPWAWRAAGPYRPLDDGVFVLLAALQAMAAMQSIPCSGFL